MPDQSADARRATPIPPFDRDGKQLSTVQPVTHPALATAPREIPAELRDTFQLVTLLAVGANIIMELAMLPVGHGVARSTVESGRLDRHPFKRLRTTLSYFVVALLGTDEERTWLREEVNRSHRSVHSKPGDPVKYNAFDRDQQLWVAACVYQGIEDLMPYLAPGITEEQRDTIHQHCARFATSLQVPADMWPVDRAAHREYWDSMVPTLCVDEVSGQWLRTNIVELGFLPALRPLVPIARFFTIGFLHPPFRELLDLPWTEQQQRRFDRTMTVLGRINRNLPAPVRRFPWNFYLRDFRHRTHSARPFV